MSIFDVFLLIGLGLILLELIIGVETGFDLVVIGFTMIVSGFIGRWFASTEVMIALTVLLSVSYILIGRSIVKEKIKVHPHASNADTLLDQVGVVMSTIQPHHPGTVRIEGEEWRAKSKQKLAIGTEVIVREIQGVTVTVEKE